MKKYIVILISLLFLSVYCFKYEELSLNKPYTLKSEEKHLQFYLISFKGMKTFPKEIKIETQIVYSRNPLTSTIGIHYQPFKKTNFKQIKKEVLGNTLIIDEEFIKSSVKEDKNIYIAIYCENCYYKVKMESSGELILDKNFIQNAPLRGLIEQENYVLDLQINNDTDTRMNVYGANGVSGLIVAFFMIFVSVIACIIMMKIYVHNTALVEQPLKLGRIEA